MNIDVRRALTLQLMVISGSVTCGSPSGHPLHSPNGNPQKNPFSAEARHLVRPRPT